MCSSPSPEREWEWLRSRHWVLESGVHMEVGNAEPSPMLSGGLANGYRKRDRVRRSLSSVT